MTETILVSSSLLAVVAYSNHASLDLTFRNGAVYRYFDVPPSVFEQLINAESKGFFFNRAIRNRFSYRRLA